MKKLLTILLLLVTPFLPQAQESDGTAGVLQTSGYYLYDITEKWDVIGINGGWSVGNGVEGVYSEYQYFGTLNFNNHDLEMMKAKLTVYGDTINIRDITLRFPLQGSAFEVISETLFIEEASNNNPIVRLSPNPADMHVTIQASSLIDKVDIYSITGQQVYKSKVNNTETTINVSNLANETYIVNIWMGTFVKSKKLIVI